MEFLKSTLGWEWEVIATSVSSGVLVVNSGRGVEWLMDITGVVDEESHGGGCTVFLGVVFVGVAHDSFVFIGVLVAVSLVEPHLEGSNDLSDVVLVLDEIEVLDFATLIEEWSINEMPSLLVHAALILNVIGESSAFSEWMFVFVLGPFWVGSLELLKDIDSSSEFSWGFLGKDLLSNS